jgi:hypothetical protein
VNSNSAEPLPSGRSATKSRNFSIPTVLNGIDMEEIDPTNIVGRRTRGKKIDYAKEAAAAGNELEDDDEDDEEYVDSSSPTCLRPN